MPGRKMRTSRPLMLTALILCLIIGGSFTRSSANPSSLGNSSMPDMFVADKPEETEIRSDSVKADTDQPTDNSQPKIPAVTTSPSPAPAQKPVADRENAQVKASPEAAKGTWAPSGSNWIFLVDGAPYNKGWFTDTDGKRYYFDKNGIMQTGWLDADGKRYYLDLDGIMQTGTISVEGKNYTLKKDGSLKGYKPKKVSKKPKSEKEATKETDPAKTEKKYVALTFDDGPSSFTGRLLDCLKENKAKATFFMVGTEISSFPEEVKRMAKQGHELGNHTYDHKDLTTLSTEDIQSKIQKVDSLLEELTGKKSTVMRPPYGAINDSVKGTVTTPMILWSIDTLDWESKDVQKIVDTVMEHITDGSVILMHDIYSTTVDATEILVPRLIKEGYEFVTIHELAKIKGKELKSGIAYGEMK